MTKGEYKKQLYSSIEEKLNGDIKLSETKQKTARGDFKKGIQAGIRKEAERIKEILK